jgi:TonB family protein
MSISSHDVSGNYFASVPNSNRSSESEQGIDAHQDIAWAPYISKLRDKVKQQWVPGFTESSRRTVLLITIDRSGQISDLQIIQPSGLSATDQAAYNAIKRAAPFAPLPTAYAGNYINIKFIFDINIHGQLDLQGGG